MAYSLGGILQMKNFQMKFPMEFRRELYDGILP